MTLLCKLLGHKLVLDAGVCQEKCVRRRCHYWRGLSETEVEHLLDGDVDAGLCHEPELTRRERRARRKLQAEPAIPF